MDKNYNLRVLELYAGIGGWHYALKQCVTDHITFELLLAVDINTTTNLIYKHNFPKVTLLHRNIQSLTAAALDNLRANVWTLSPPCQPFTRSGKKMDVEDRRSDSFKALMSTLLQMLHPPEYLLLENVHGFEQAEAHSLLIDTLKQRDYFVQEFLLSPTQLGIPNSRSRYYALAKRLTDGVQRPLNGLQRCLPVNAMMMAVPASIADYLEKDGDEQRRAVEDRVLGRHGAVLDIVDRTSLQSDCFTKSYTAYAEGTGSVLCTNDCIPHDEISTIKDSALFRAFHLCTDESERATLLRPLALRYFSPREVANLMGFPSSFEQPPSVAERQMYRALGNSINVSVVAVLLKYLFSEDFENS